MSKCKQHAPEFKSKAALEGLKGEETAAELASQFGVHPTMIQLTGLSGLCLLMISPKGTRADIF
ncbi:transposase [Hyphobacterium sp. CCMP332]|uniref:transposase n=1 Tax=Hyphobacterium sp. CCMP332 TaxID=2749086 RepID=UPI00164FE91B|nr:transposase [Hyphobacterium sp. CCMP332]